MVDPGWYADPAGRYPHRYWDGARWTDHVGGPAGQGVDPLVPNPSTARTQENASQPGHSPASAAARGPVRGDPTELQGVLSELGIQPMPAGNGTPYGEPMLVLAFSVDRPDSLEWWTPAGVLVAVATIIEKQKPGSLEPVNTDPASGAMIGTRIDVVGADGSPIVTTVRTLKPTKPPTYVDDPSGRRCATIAQEKVLSKTPTYALTGPDGVSLGRFVGSDKRARTVALSDPAGRHLVTVVKYGTWDGPNVALEFSRNRPFQTPSLWLATRAVSAIWPIKRERICSVLIRQSPAADSTQALVMFLAPLLLEHVASLL